LGDGSPLAIPVNRAIIQKGLNRQLVYYWFEQSGRRMTSDYQAKLSSIWDRIFHGRSDGGLVRLVTPIAPNEDPAKADARLLEFMKVAVPVLPEYFPPI
jgi:EpsI family protein